MAGIGGGVQGSPLCEWLEGHTQLSLSRPFCLTSFSFKIGILHVEPAIEDSEN